MVRKEGKDVNSKLVDSTEKFNIMFDDIQKISYDFVEEINQSKIEKFEDFFEKNNNQILKINEKIPTLKREIRKFGIY
jgi:replicative DNA helicase